MKMTEEAAESLNRYSAEATPSMNALIKELLGDKGGFSFQIPKPQNACILDKDGYIACGPIVGLERPSEPIKKPDFTLYNELNPEKPRK